jgi:DNA helicase-2/ATP-dependent DNA helicase PcrA
MDYLQGLNERQKEAVLHTEGPLLIVAGAGAGKTKTITHRIAHLVVHAGAHPSEILAVTFTNKAGKEMRERVGAILAKQNIYGKPFVSTFHALGVSILRENYEAAKLPRSFVILDESDSVALVKQSIIDGGFDPKQFEPKKFKSIISKQKSDGVTVSEFAKNISSYSGETIHKIWKRYEELARKEGGLDFDDLLLTSVNLLEKNPEVRKKYTDRFRYVHIDEYQDTNELQYTMVMLLTGENKNICVVGDNDQCVKMGTKITMADTTVQKIENLKKGDLVLSNYGSGDFRPSRILNKKITNYTGDLIKIETTQGFILETTPEHTHFAGYMLGKTPQLYINYLMYKKNIGWRIGTSSVYTNSQKKSVIGFIQRSNQEHADSLWVIGTYNFPQDARVAEYIFSLKYQIPTVPFVPRKGISKHGYVHDKKHIEKIFSSIDTQDGAVRLLYDLGLSIKNPHHFPQTSNSNRRNINIVLCGDRRGKTPMHLISIFGNDDVGKKILSKNGFSIRKSKINSSGWRFETARSSYGEICLLATRIASLFDDVNFVFRARLGGKKQNVKDGNSLPCIPAGSTMPGMVVFTEQGYDTVKKITKIKVKNKKVYDLDIEHTHNFIANNIVTHNCIYSWRGANIKNILNFEKDFPSAKVVLLEENYRSTSTILSAANEVIKKNKERKDKTLFTKNGSGESITLCEAYDEASEAEFVVGQIYELLKNGADPEKIAVLYRANFQSRTFEDALLMAQIPYQVLGTKFFERKEVKDVLCYIRAALNPESFSDIRRIINVPTRGIGKTTVDKLFAVHVKDGMNPETITGSGLPVATQKKIGDFFLLLKRIREFIETHEPSEVVRFVVTETGFEKLLKDGTEEDRERLENMRELATLATRYDKQSEIENTDALRGIEKLLEDAALASDQDTLLKDTKGVRLMTVHASKGLEFQTVFVVGLEHDLFPHSRGNGGTKEEKEEERRLFYVAITRAEKKLYLTHASVRTIFGSRQIQTPSEFLYDIPEENLERESFGSRYSTGRVIFLD